MAGLGIYIQLYHGLYISHTDLYRDEAQRYFQQSDIVSRASSGDIDGGTAQCRNGGASSLIPVDHTDHRMAGATSVQVFKFI